MSGARDWALELNGGHWENCVAVPLPPAMHFSQ